MSCTNKSTALDMLSFRKSIYLDELKAPMPLAQGTAPRSHLPRWNRLPLEAKMPMMPSGLQVGEFHTRRKLGRGLRLPFHDPKRFDTSDPFNHDAPLAYDGLHDRHLAPFFRASKQRQDVLVKAGMITPELDVKCNLREYNAYRKYLRMMQGKYLKKELEHRDETQQEKRILDITATLAEKKMERIKKVDTVLENKERIDSHKRSKLQEYSQKQAEDERRVRSMRERDAEYWEMKRLESMVRRDRLVAKLKAMAKDEQQKLLNLLKQFHERDQRLRRDLRELRHDKRRRKVRCESCRFEDKKRSQEAAIERDARLKRCAARIRESFIATYERKIEESRRRLKELFIAKRENLEKSLKAKRKKKRKSKKGPQCFCKVN
ncbi:hypothetical protein TKK_0000067 [Trichogramma kaykai]